MKQAKCGNCGCATATVAFERQDGGAPFVKMVQLTCTQCESRTDIHIYADPKICVSFPRDEGEKDQGVFCVMR